MRRERSTNEYTFEIYFFLNLIMTLLVSVWYENNMLINLKIGSLKLNKNTSVDFFIIFSVIFYIIGLLLTMDRNRTKFQLIANAFFPVEIYTLITYFNVWPLLVGGTIIGTVIAVSLYLILYFKIQKRPVRRKNAKKQWFRNALLSARVLTSLMLSVLLIVPLLGFIQKPEQEIVEEMSAINFLDENKWSIEEQRNVILTLEKRAWEELGLGERINVLQIISNIECVELGIPYMLTVSAKDLEGNVAGSYSDWSKTILIDKEHLQTSDSSECLSTLLHECRHAFQEISVNLYEMCGEEYKNSPIFREAVIWKKEFENYISANDDNTNQKEEYYYQSCETDARQYADVRKWVYIEIYKNT
mgnify:CR=1 FL=1